jgi:hypothetical protein
MLRKFLPIPPKTVNEPILCGLPRKARRLEKRGPSKEGRISMPTWTFYRKFMYNLSSEFGRQF